MCLEKVLGDYDSVIENFKVQFFYLHEHFDLSFTLKIHVIIHHYSHYFSQTGKTMRHTNGEFTESCHSSLRQSEEQHNFRVVKNLGTPVHQQKALQSHNFFNARRSGSITPLRLRKPSTPSSASSTSSLSTPRGRSNKSIFSKRFSEKYPSALELHKTRLIL